MSQKKMPVKTQCHPPFHGALKLTKTLAIECDTVKSLLRICLLQLLISCLSNFYLGVAIMKLEIGENMGPGAKSN